MRSIVPEPVTRTNHYESRTGHLLALIGLRDFERQFHLGPYRLDIAFPLERIAIEADGYPHSTEVGRRRDRARDKQLQAWGWETHRIAWWRVEADDDEDTPYEQLRDAAWAVLATRRVPPREIKALIEPLCREGLPRSPVERAKAAYDRLGLWDRL